MLKKARRRLLSALAAAVTLVLVLSAPAFAYHLEGPCWSNQRSSGCCATFYTQYASTFYSGDKAGFDNARSAWNGSSANVLFYSGSSPITVDDTDNASVSWDGITNHHWTACGFLWLSRCFDYAHVLLNYHFTKNDSASTTKGIAAHELGHAIGLDHTSGCVLMTPYTSTRNSCGIYGPVSDDINGVNSLY
jgi:hypothetical protein